MTAFVASDQPISTARMELTPLHLEHADEMAVVLSDPALYAIIGGAPPTVDQLRGRYEQLVAGRSPDGRQQWLNWTVRLRQEVPTTAVGTVQATIAPDGAEIAWIIGTPWQGRGYASEAATALTRWLHDGGRPGHRAHPSTAPGLAGGRTTRRPDADGRVRRRRRALVLLAPASTRLISAPGGR